MLCYALIEAFNFTEQIAALRRTMDEERGQHSSPNDDLRFFELLGEGTFGKVHRGAWRSTEVAIKSIMVRKDTQVKVLGHADVIFSDKTRI